MGLKIKTKLSTNDILETVKILREYKNTIRFKTALFVQRLAEIGLATIEAHKYSQGDSDFNDLHSYMLVDEQDTFVRATLMLSGRHVAFIEFGAGIHYNGSAGSSPNPKGSEFGMTIGSYGKGYGANDYWYYFDRETGKGKRSQGTEAAMPMYYADQEILNKVEAIAKEVFG